MRSVMEQAMMGGSPSGMLSFAWGHLITHALLTAVSMTLAAHAIAGEIENGAMELVLAQPISRVRYLSAHLLFGIGAIALVAPAGIVGSIVGQDVFHVNAFPFDRNARLLLNILLLQSAIYGVTLLASSFGREAGQVAIVGVLIAVVSYLIDAVGNLWSKAAFIPPYSLHHYYEPHNILVDGTLRPIVVIVLAAFALLTITTAFARFGS